MKCRNHQQKGYVRRAAEKRKPRLVEPVKSAMMVKGQKTSQTIKDVLGDLVCERGEGREERSKESERKK